MDPLQMLRISKAIPKNFELEVHPSLAIPEIERRLSERGEKANILDLGKAFGSNLDFYTRFADLIHFDDLLESISVGKCDKLDLDKLLRFPEGFKFDVILCWDILNYLNLEQRKVLSKVIVDLSKKDSMLFALISKSNSLPVNPSAIRVARGNKLCYDFTTNYPTHKRSAEPISIEGEFRGYKRSRAFRLRNGFEEHLYTFVNIPTSN